jgi:hypothetical protein
MLPKKPIDESIWAYIWLDVWLDPTSSNHKKSHIAASLESK